MLENKVNDRYPIPNMNEKLEKLGKFIYFTTTKLEKGFHQIKWTQNRYPRPLFNQKWSLRIHKNAVWAFK